ncbi:MAG: SAM hydrolase/SAM-dependent halogenase family protein [Acidimicrobiales bacterium]
MGPPSGPNGAGGTGVAPVWFLSDYGLADEFVGVVRAVLRSLAPQVDVLDLSHGVAPHDVRSGSLVLARAIQYLSAGVVLAVVDPGVGTSRRAVAVEISTASADAGVRYLVGPDNGLLAPAVAMVGGAGRAVHLTRTELHLAAPGPTFAGRDVFAPAAAHLATGGVFEDLGELIDPMSLMPGLVPLPQESAGGVAAEILWVDRFGNAQLNIGPEDLPDYQNSPGPGNLGSPESPGPAAKAGSPGQFAAVTGGGAENGGGPEHRRVEASRPEPRDVAGPATLVLRARGQTRTAYRVTTFDDLKPGQVGLMVDSYGLVALVCARRSAAEELGLSEGDAVWLGRESAGP